MTRLHPVLFGGLLLPAGLLGACTDGTDDEHEHTDIDSDADSDSASDEPVFETRIIDATRHDDRVYVDLSSGEVLDLDTAQAADSTAWHLAFQRFSVTLNGGDAGPGTLTAGLSVAQDDLYDDDGNPDVDAFLGATSADGAALFEGTLPTPEAFTEPLIEDVLGDAWYSYDSSTGTLTGDDSVGWLLRGGEGASTSRLRIIEVDYPTRTGEGIKTFTARFEVFEQGGFGRARTWTTSLGPEGGALCYDADADSEVACEGTAWDLQLYSAGRTFGLRTNSGDAGPGAGGATEAIPWADLETWTSAEVDPAGNTVPFATDDALGVFDHSPWWAYGLEGGHRLWPNYRVYLLDDGDERYAVQIAGYYGEDGNAPSGTLVLRWMVVP